MAEDKTKKALNLLIKNKEEGRISIENPEELMQKLTARYGDKAYDLVVNALVKPKTVMDDLGQTNRKPSSAQTLMYLVSDEISKENIEKLGGQVAYGEDYEGSRKQAKEDNTNANAAIEKTTKEVADYNKEWEAYIQSQIEPHLTPQQREETITVTKEDNANANATIEKTQEEIAVYKNWQEIMDAIPTFNPQILNKEQEEITIPLRPREEQSQEEQPKDRATINKEYTDKVADPNNWNNYQGSAGIPIPDVMIDPYAKNETLKQGDTLDNTEDKGKDANAGVEVRSIQMPTTGDYSPQKSAMLAGLDITNTQTTEFNGKDVVLTDNGISVTDKEGNGYGAIMENGKIEYFNLDGGTRKPIDDIEMNTISNLRNIHNIAINQNPESTFAKTCLELGSPSQVRIQDNSLEVNNSQTTTHILMVGYNHYSEQDKALLAQPNALKSEVKLSADEQFKAAEQKADNTMNAASQKADNVMNAAENKANQQFEAASKAADAAFGKSSFDNDPFFKDMGDPFKDMGDPFADMGDPFKDMKDPIKDMADPFKDMDASSATKTEKIGQNTVSITDNSITSVNKDGNGYGAVVSDKGGLDYFVIKNGKKQPISVENRGSIRENRTAELAKLNEMAIALAPETELSKAAIKGGKPYSLEVIQKDVRIITIDHNEQSIADAKAHVERMKQAKESNTQGMSLRDRLNGMKQK